MATPSPSLLDGAALACVQVVDADLDLEDGLVSDCPIGAAIGADGFDLDRISNQVVFENTERNVARDSLPVPAPAPLMRR